jgi:sugar/nucleoside kinase (ribokinase family)
MRYIVVSTLVTDRVTLADGSFAGEFPGGAGLYALCGLRLWTDDVLLVTGIGRDFESSSAYNWFTRYGIPLSGLSIRDKHGAISEVKYRSDGDRTETPPYGLEHYHKLEATPEDIAPHCADAKGMYIFKDFGPDGYWDKIFSLKERYGFTLMWELNADVAKPAFQKKVRDTAGQTDILSLNYREAASLLSASDRETVIETFKDWKLPCVFLRTGVEGSLLLIREKVLKIPPVTGIKVVDATGAGNASSSAVLRGVCEGLPPAECGMMGSVSAAFCIKQFGPPDLNSRAKEDALNILSTMKTKGECYAEN